MIKISGRKAQISDTLTWIVATLIIFFIMFFFVAISSLMAYKEKITLSALSAGKEKIQPVSDFALTENLVGFLEKPVKEGRMIDAILSSLDILIDKNVDLTKVNYENLEPDTKYLVDLKKQEIFSETKILLGRMCSEYMLKIPQGIITNSREDFVSESGLDASIGEETLIAEWADWIALKIPYKEKIIEIKYRQLKKC